MRCDDAPRRRMGRDVLYRLALWMTVFKVLLERVTNTLGTYP